MKCQGLLVAVVMAILSSGTAQASAKARPVDTGPAPVTAPGKLVVRLESIQNVTIALPQAINPVSGGPGAPEYNFGPNLQASLAEKLQNTHYVLDEQKPQPVRAASAAEPSPSPSPSPTDEVWDGSSVVPAATFTFTVDALALRTGGHGDSMFYGFDERLRTPFNDGLGTLPNEFPLNLIQFQHWFDRTFQDKGTSPFDSQSGLDLGQGFTLNALVAWIDVKYAAYHSAIRMHVVMDAPLAGRHEVKTVQVKGGGFYFDIVGGYEQWSGGIGLARTDAMRAAFKNAFAGSFSVIDEWAKSLPLTAKVYGWKAADHLYLNTGPNSNIAVGTQYASVDDPNLIFEVTQSVPSGSIAKLDSGALGDVRIGMVLVEKRAAATAVTSRSAPSTQPTPAAAESVTLPNQNLPRSDFSGNGYNVTQEFWQGLLKSTIGAPLLPYRIWRYYQYDQSYLGPDWQYRGPNGYVDADGNLIACQQSDVLDPCYKGKLSKDSPQPDIPQGNQAWAEKVKSEPWARQIGLDTAPEMTNEGPVVAVIDSGVDYNHPSLNERIWVNPQPTTDPDGNTDSYGWDFISGDPRPFDDGYHGTEVAGAVLGVAPRVKIMPLKIFNPFGITSSAAIYGAFQYAVNHGAKIIVAPWATQKQTQAIEMSIKYARDHGALVVVSAGDRGDDLGKVASYPAVLSKTYDNVITVTGVDLKDQLVKVKSFYANYDASSVTIAAPGQNILVTQPRGHTSHDTTTSVAAGLVAGAIARNWAASEGSGTYADWIKELKDQAQVVPGLAGFVQGGLRLRVK